MTRELTTAEDAFFRQYADRKDEPLHPDLAVFLEEMGSGEPGDSFEGWLALKHPLVYVVPFFPDRAWQANDMLKHKEESLRKAQAEGDWESVVWLHERPHRATALLAVKDRLRAEPERYWKLAGDVWVDSENIWQWGSRVRRVLGTSAAFGPLPHREAIMLPEEREALATLPEFIDVWRGYPNPGGTQRGWSWTLDPGKAKWWAHRLRRSGQASLVAHAEVPARNVIAHFTRRNEAEIVFDPRRIRNITVSVLESR